MKHELLIFLFYGFFYCANAFMQQQYIPSSFSYSNPNHNPKNTPKNTPNPPQNIPIAPTPNPNTPRQKNSTAIMYKSALHAPIPDISEEKIPPLTEEDFQFQLQWYVIAESQNIQPHTPYEAKIWGITYVYWKDQQNKYYAIQNICNHRGAALSKGCINPESNCIQCPYHGLEFDGEGYLKKIPGQTMGPKSVPSVWNQARFPILEKEGWIYLNIVSTDAYNSCRFSQKTLEKTLYTEPEAHIQPSSRVFCNIPSVPTYARIVSENLLDILHITFVHSFGNKDSPIPLNEPMPYILRAYNKEGIMTSFTHQDNQTTIPIDNEISPIATSATSNRQKQTRKNKDKRVVGAKTKAIIFRNQMFAILNPITTMSKKWLFPVEKDITTNTEPSTTTNAQHPQPVANESIPSKNQHYGIRYLFETNENSVIRKIFRYNHIIIETEFLLPHLTVSRVRFGTFYKTVVAFTLPVSDKETHLFIKLYRNYWVKDTVPALPFPFNLVSHLLGSVVETVSDGLMLWMLKETFKEDAGVLERLSNDAEQQGKYNLKYDKFPYLYRNLYKKYIHSKETQHQNQNHNHNLFPPFFSVLPRKSETPLLDKIENNGTFSTVPLPPLKKTVEREPIRSRKNKYP